MSIPVDQSEQESLAEVFDTVASFLTEGDREGALAWMVSYLRFQKSDLSHTLREEIEAAQSSEFARLRVYLKTQAAAERTRLNAEVETLHTLCQSPKTTRDDIERQFFRVEQHLRLLARYDQLWYAAERDRQEMVFQEERARRQDAE